MGLGSLNPFDCSFALTSFAIVLLRNGNTSKYSKSVSLLTWWIRTNLNNAIRRSRRNHVVVAGQFTSPDSTVKSTLRVVFHFRHFPMLQVGKPGFWLAASSYASVRNPAPRKMPPQCGQWSEQWLQMDIVLDMFRQKNLILISLCSWYHCVIAMQSPWKNMKNISHTRTWNLLCPCVLSPLTCRVESSA